MARINNPFVVTGKIEAEFFCDRVVESARVYLPTWAYDLRYTVTP